MPATFPTTLDHDYLSASLFFLQLLLLSNKLKLRNLKTSNSLQKTSMDYIYTHGEESASARENRNLCIYVIGGDSSYSIVTHTEYQRQENTRIGLEFIHGITPLLTVLTR